VYAKDKRFNWPATLRIAKGMASAAQHLHTRGILHGDFYAHNILHTSDGDALLSDFGAAAFFDVNDATLAQGLEKLEARALGCLLEELALQCDASSLHSAAEAEKNTATSHMATAPLNTPQLQALTRLAQQCLQETPTQRPSLAQICTELDTLSQR
jgi:serine/threonine protein kinase